MIKKTKAYLEAKGAFSSEQSAIIEKIANTIPFTTVPDKMKLTIATSELITYAAQFRRNILHWDRTLVPINGISMVLTASGKNKDSSVRAVRKCFKPSYQMMDELRESLSIAEAKRLANEAGETDHKAFLNDVKPAPIFISPTTEGGLITHINELGRYPIGSGLLYSGEFGDELATSMDMLDNIKTLSEVYDLGEKEGKFTKGKEYRTEAITGQPVNALLVSSPTFILYEESVKKKFQMAFMSKLARRCNFCYVQDSLKEPEFDEIEGLLHYAKTNTSSTNDLQDSIAESFLDITKYQIDQKNAPLPVDPEVQDLFIVYHRYNSDLADTMPSAAIATIVRAHLQWKALKLAGALAIIDCSDSVTAQHYIDAINFYEMLAPDIDSFESELNKLPYERFADYIKTIVDPTTGKASIDIHNLKKKGFIATASKTTLKALITPAAVYDKLGLYTVSDDATYIHYERIIKSDTINVSVKPINNDKLFSAISSKAEPNIIRDLKSKIATTATYGYETEQCEFSDLAQLLQGNFAYSPFIFKDGVRGKENVISGTKWLVLDIDTSNITAQEAHFLLSDYNHHIALGSDPSNEFKFRVLLELDSVVEVSPIIWRNFYTLIAEDLLLNVDPLPQSQIFYSYWGDAERSILSVTDATPIEVRDYLMRANEASENAPSRVASTLSESQKRALIQDKRTTFARAFESINGSGSRDLYWAASYAYKDLGMSKEDTIELIHEINNYWVSPMPEDRLQLTLLQQIQRW